MLPKEFDNPESAELGRHHADPVLRQLAIEDLRALVQGILAFDRAVRELAEGAIER